MNYMMLYLKWVGCLVRRYMGYRDYNACMLLCCTCACACEGGRERYTDRQTERERERERERVYGRRNVRSRYLEAREKGNKNIKDWYFVSEDTL
jgi:hypothetical protein